MWTLTFWRSVLERALKTAAQSAVLAVGADSLSANALSFDWRLMGGFALGGAVLSVLTSIASAVTTDGSPSLNGAEILTPTEPAPAIVPTEPWPTSVVVIDGVTTTHWSDKTQTTDRA